MDNGLLLGTHSGSFCGFSKFYEMSTAKWNQIILWHVKIIPLFPSFWLQTRIFFLSSLWQPILLKLFTFSQKKNLKEMVICYQNCSDLLWENCSSDREKRLKFEAEGWELANILITLEQFIQKGKKVRTVFETGCFFTCSWRFLRSNTLKQL